MPKAYFIFTEAVKDIEALNAYLGKAAPTAAPHGGVPLVIHDSPDVIEGSWHGDRVVVVEFPSMEAAKAWYQSDDYQAVIGERFAAADCNAVLVPGFEPPAS